MKTPRPTPSSGFTLIELLVVISIIAILAGIALPVFSTVQVKGAQTKALSNAKQIGIACTAFAIDNNGLFPTNKLDQQGRATGAEVDNSNEAFAQLIPDYLNTEQIFFVPKSAFTPVQPDEKMTNDADKLKTKENHWAYVLNLSTTSSGAWPLIADGMASESQHTYTQRESDKGGIWRGKQAIIVNVDTSARVDKLDPKTRKVRGSPNGNDLFDTSQDDWLGSSNKVVNPK